MEGYTHALSGAAGWMAVTSSSAVALGAWEQSTPVVLGGAVVCAGWALWPDADHADATIAHSLPPVTNIMARGIGTLSGGHRHGTHSLIGIVVFTVIAALAALPTAEIHGKTVPIGSLIITVLCVAFASKSLGLNKGWAPRGVARDIVESSMGSWVLALGAAGAVTWFLDYKWTWLPQCAALGVFIHILGDFLTPQGVPWLWPWNPKPPRWWPSPLGWFWHRNGYFRIPLLGKTQGRAKGRRVVTREHLLATVLGLYVTYVTGATIMLGSNSTVPYLH